MGWLTVGSVDDGEDVALAQNGVGGAVDGDFGAAVFGDEYLVVDGDAEGNGLAILVAAAGADGAHDGFLRLFLGGIRQEELAEALGVSRQTIGSLENGRYNPSILLAFKIARYFGLSIEEIFIYEEEQG